MTIERETNTARLHHRVNVPLNVVIDGRVYRTMDWSLGGFAIAEYGGSESSGARVDGSLILPFSGFKVDFPVRFEIVRRDGNSLGCSFIDLDETPRKAMRTLMEAAIEGRLAEAGEVLTTIQEPEAPQPEELLKENPDFDLALSGEHRIFRGGLLYLAASILVLSSVGVVTWRSTSFIDIPDGIVMGNFAKVAAPVAGRLVAIHVAEGETVEAGRLLYTLESQPLEGSVARAEAELARAEAQVTADTHRLAEEKSRLELFSQVTHEQVAGAEAALRSLEAKIEFARLEHERLETLYAQGIRSREDVDKAKQHHRSLVEQHEVERSQRRIIGFNVQATQEGRFFGGREIEGRTQDLKEELRVARSERDRAARELEIALDALGQTRVTTLENGLVYAIYRHLGEMVRPNDAVLALRSSGDHWAVGRLLPADAIRIRPGMDAELLIPSLSIRAHGRVTAIGHQAVSSTSQISADLESALSEVPIKIALPQLPEGVPPGIRAEIRIYTPLNWMSERAPKANPAPASIRSAPAA